MIPQGLRNYPKVCYLELVVLVPGALCESAPEGYGIKSLGAYGQTLEQVHGLQSVA